MSVSVGTSTSSPDLRRELSSSLANSLIQNDEVDPEQQPLRRQNSPAANHQRFQQNQRTAAQGVVQRSGWVLLIAAILISMLFFVWVVFYVKGWNVWREHRNKPCDKPLADWLFAMLILPLMAMAVECCSCKRLRLLLVFVTLLVLLMGIQYYYQSKTCYKTNPELYTFVEQYLIFLTIWWISWVVMPLLFLAVVIYGMWHGWFDELNGASPDTIKNVETVAYDPALFAEEGTSEDGKAPPECCICTERFEEKLEIKRTQCQHYFHEECLGKWLRVSTTCPLCRNDLERATLGDDARQCAPQQPRGLWPGAVMPYNELQSPELSEEEALRIAIARSQEP